MYAASSAPGMSLASMRALDSFMSCTASAKSVSMVSLVIPIALYMASISLTFSSTSRISFFTLHTLSS